MPIHKPFRYSVNRKGFSWCKNISDNATYHFWKCIVHLAFETLRKQFQLVPRILWERGCVNRSLRPARFGFYSAKKTVRYIVNEARDEAKSTIKETARAIKTEILARLIPFVNGRCHLKQPLPFLKQSLPFITVVAIHNSRCHFNPRGQWQKRGSSRK